MKDVQLKSLDTTALLVFHTLIDEGSVSRTALRLGMTQSAVSHALGRLRMLWKDPLFVRDSGAMRPTQKALALAPGVANALRELSALVRHDGDFDPARQRRRFVLGMSDYAASIFLPALAGQCAPYRERVSFLVRHTNRAIGFEMLDRGEIECVVGNFAAVPKRLRQRTLFEERFACAMTARHKLSKEAFTLDRYLGADHVHVSLAGESTGLPDRALSQHGRSRNISMTVGHFLVVPRILAASTLIATEPRAIIAPFAGDHGLVLREPPFDIAPFSFSVVWHGRSDTDPALAWLIELLQTLSQNVLPKAQ